MNSFNARRREQAQAGLRNRQGFALLLEVLIVLFILGLIAGAYYGNVGERIMNARIEAEDAVLRDMADAIRQSLNSTDLTNVNIAAIPGEIGGTDTPTQFSTSTSPTYLTTANNDWFAKLARLRGVPVTVGVSPGQQPQLSRILYNSMNQPRMLFIRPTVGADSVELMLVSLLATLLDNMGSVAHSMGRPVESERYRREALPGRVSPSAPRLPTNPLKLTQRAAHD